MQIFFTALTVPFVITVSTLTLFLGNQNEYLVKLSELYLYLGCVLVVIATFLFLILFGISKWPTILKIVIGLLVGISIAILVQGQLFQWNFGPLDGRGINWNEWGVHAIAEVVFWLLAIGVCIAVAIHSISFINKMVIWIFIFGTASLLSIWITSDEVQANEVTRKYTKSYKNDLFRFHEKNNTLLIILDTIQADVFEEIYKKWPEEVDFLNGFTFYPDAVGGYPTTRASVPLILSGLFYKNEGPIKTWQKLNVSSHNIAKYYSDIGYNVQLAVNGAPTGGLEFPTSYFRGLNYNDKQVFIKQVLSIIDAGIFRSVPTLVKPMIYNSGNWFFAQHSRVPFVPPGRHGYDLRFLRIFEDTAHVKSVNNGEFKYIHTRGAHAPFQLDQNFRYIGNQAAKYKGNPVAKREAYINQIRGALSILRGLLSKLKSLGIYDSAQILVAGDHGTSAIPSQDIKMDSESNANDIPGKVLSSSRPLFLYKDSMSTEGIAYSDAPVHLGDIVCMLSYNDELFNCSKNEHRVRVFLFYKSLCANISETLSLKSLLYKESILLCSI